MSAPIIMDAIIPIAAITIIIIPNDEKKNKSGEKGIPSVDSETSIELIKKYPNKPYKIKNMEKHKVSMPFTKYKVLNVFRLFFMDSNCEFFMFCSFNGLCKDSCVLKQLT